MYINLQTNSFNTQIFPFIFANSCDTFKVKFVKEPLKTTQVIHYNRGNIQIRYIVLLIAIVAH